MRTTAGFLLTQLSKNSNPNADYFGRYDGNLIILSQGLSSFASADINIQNVPLQTFYSLNGMKLMHTEHGINIINGKKVFVR